MTTPDVADPTSSYGMPTGGFSDYRESVTDPSTDWPAGNPPGATGTGGNGANQMIVDVAQMTHTSRRAWVRFQGHATTPVLLAHDAHWGSGDSTKPTVTHQGVGHYRVQWPTSITDPLGTIRNINIRWANSTVEGATPYWKPQVDYTDAHTIEVYTFDATHVAADLAGVNFFVEAG